jgi:hypothetical protein
LKQTFQPHTFDFLVNTRHIDPDNNLAFIIKKIRKHGSRIAVDRQILGSNPLAKISLDSINAFDALLFTLQSDPALPVPNIFEDLKAIFAPVQTYNLNRPAGGKTHDRPRINKSNIDREIDREDRSRSACIPCYRTHLPI